MRVLVVNAGSSSVKLSLLDGDRTERAGTADLDDAHAAVERLLADAPAPDAVGHRIVHGGDRFAEPAVVDDAVVAALTELRALAPLHQGPALAALDQVRTALPDVPQVVCFDTAFHRTLPPAASTYAVPRSWGVRRFGFHGLAHAWAARRAAELVGRSLADLRTVSAHLGSGASLCAVDRGRSVDTTMGFTPAAGLVMGSRSGDLDPAVPLWLVEQGVAAADVTNGLEREGGLRALAGTGDARQVQEAADAGDPDAALALDVWGHRARGLLAAMAAAMGGLDVLVFGGGVGEHQPRLRARAVAGLEFLGITLDAAANEAAREGDALVGAGPVAVAVVTAREDLMIAEGVRAALGDV